jgi:hypothetical protein
MCRPSCCKKSSSDGTAIAAIAAIAAGAIVAVKIGPTVARILHLAAEVLMIVMLTAATALACIIIGWLTIRIARWRVRQHSAHRGSVPGRGAVHVAGASPGKSPLMAAQVQQAINDGAILYVVDLKAPQARHQAIAGARYHGVYRECLIPASSDHQDAG